MRFPLCRIEKVGPIDNATVEFGDITVLVGPQGAGKSMFLELFKFWVDFDFISGKILRYGGTKEKILDLYLGMHMDMDVHSLFKEHMQCKFIERTKGERVLYIPAHRTAVLKDGLPPLYTAWVTSAPFVLRYFGERLSLWLRRKFEDGQTVMPRTKSFTYYVRDTILRHIYRDSHVEIDTTPLGQRRLVLSTEHAKLEPMRWSTGQREVTPLLMDMDTILSKRGRKSSSSYISYIVVEEPEMGLHMEGVRAILLLLLHALAGGYKVIITTHSSSVMQFIWGLQMIGKMRLGVRKDVFMEMFDINVRGQYVQKYIVPIVKATSNVKVYYFEDGKACPIDITSPDVKKHKLWGGELKYIFNVPEVIYRWQAMEEEKGEKKEDNAEE